MSDDPFWRKLHAHYFPLAKPRTPRDIPKGEPGSGWARVTNAKTGEVKVVKVPAVNSLIRDTEAGISKVPWCPHKCETDLDGDCQHGWPSRVHRFAV